MIFDTASMYFRAFFGLKAPLRAADGTPVNAVRGLLDAMARLVDQYQPTRLACAWDNDWRPQWRVDLVPSYKTHRLVEAVPAGHDVIGAGGRGAASGTAEDSPDDLAVQIPIILDVLDALGIAVVGRDDHEADDVAASLAAQSTVPALVVTGDRDLFQLAHGHTRVIYIGKGVAKHDLVDSAWVQQRHGVPAERYVDYAVLRGDPSDGLPGVKGIGEKSAAHLVARFDSLQALADAAADPGTDLAKGVRAKLLEAADYLEPARRVVRVVDDLDLSDVETVPHPRDAARLAALGERWNLGGPLQRMTTALDAVSAS